MLLVDGKRQKMHTTHNKPFKQRVRYSKWEVDWFRYMALLLIIVNIAAISFSLAYIEQILNHIQQILNHIVARYEILGGDIAADTVVI